MKKRPIPDVLTDDERVRLLSSMPGGTLLQRRNLLMVRLMLNAGLRTQEVCDLRVSDLSFPSGKLKVRGKGGRQRILWLGDEDLALAKSYLNEAAPSGTIFETGPGGKVCTRFLRSLVAQMAKKSGIERLHCHLLRHTFGTTMLRYTKNLVLVQKALGHSDIGTTTIYTHIVDDELEAAMKGVMKP